MIIDLSPAHALVSFGPSVCPPSKVWCKRYAITYLSHASHALHRPSGSPTLLLLVALNYNFLVHSLQLPTNDQVCRHQVTCNLTLNELPTDERWWLHYRYFNLQNVKCAITTKATSHHAWTFSTEAGTKYCKGEASMFTDWWWVCVCVCVRVLETHLSRNIPLGTEKKDDCS